jgi:HAE1 family hydrophobic/amphiphilic exporter-1
MFSQFFIQRPVFACVVSIILVLIGAVTIPLLPIEQTPDITPPTVKVSTTYRGASAQVVADTVASPLEEEINGVEEMIYMESKNASDGKMEIIVTFEVGTDIDMSQVLVQNRASIAEPKLPEDVKREGLITKKQSTNMTLIVNLYSPDDKYDDIYISNYINVYIKEELKRIHGVGDVVTYGAKDFGMRIWLNPDKLKARSLTTKDVFDAIAEQNVQVAAGQIGAPPTGKGQVFQYTVNTLGRLKDVEQFEDIIIKVDPGGRILRVKDVARVELGAKEYTTYAQLNNSPSIAIGIFQLPGANALAVAEGIQAKMDELTENFPQGLAYTIAYNPTLFISASIKEVITTLFVAVILVILTVYIFLQDFRTTLIPAVTIPVSLIATFAVMMALGMSINTLTLFGLVLAIGIVVDDAIVVVENTMRIIDEEGLPSREAAVKAMQQISGPVVATTMVLLAVFVPTAMIGGITGRLYKQFALTIATATVFSSINALTLSPALCGILLRPTKQKKGFFFNRFNMIFDKSTNTYIRIVKQLVRRTFMSMVAFAIVVGLMLYFFKAVPGGFIPDEDQGYFYVQATLPDGATLERVEKVMDRVNKICKDTPGVSDIVTIGGYSLLDALNINNMGSSFVTLNSWDDRKSKELQLTYIMDKIQQELAKIEEGICIAFLPPPITGLGNASGFEFRLQDRGSAGLTMLGTVGEDMVFSGNDSPVIENLSSSFRAMVPQLFLEIDRTKVKKLGVPLITVFQTLQDYLGSSFVNDFNLFSKTFKVMIQADYQFRDKIEKINRLEVRNENGDMIPLGTLLKSVDTAGPQTVFRYNLYPSTKITGQPRAGFSSGQAIKEMEALAEQILPPMMGYEWSGITFQQLAAGAQTIFIFGLAIIFVYLFLAAQYESWSIPFAIIFSVPLAILGGILSTWLRAFDNNIYTQIAIVLLIGLSSKSAILIVEFAKERRSQGLSIIEAAIEAAKLRFRAILMTAFSFILGVVPLVIATGAGANSRRSLGTAVFGGMLAATVFGVFLIPVLYVVIQGLSEKMRKKPTIESS